jgi:hypothetical protein
MSRGRDDDRDDDRGRQPEPPRPQLAQRDERAEALRRAHARPFEPRDATRRSATLPTHHFALPDREERERIGPTLRAYRLRDTESATLVALGTFRVVFERDLEAGPYHGDADRLAQDVRHLRAQDLTDRRTVATDEAGHTTGVLTLTDAGCRLLETRRIAPDGPARQAVSGGWKRPAEILHDASLYRMYQVEAAAIEARGGHIERIVLDDELKREVYALANRGRTDSPEAGSLALAAAARACQVAIVEGHLELPDVRIEYATAEGQRTRVDLELVTSDYRRGQIAGKQAAGFTLYSAGGSAARGIHSLGGHRGAPAQDRYLSELLSL